MKVGKIFANRGVPRNKKPLQNIVYRFEKSKNEEYFICYWQYEKFLNKHGIWNFSGQISIERIKQLLTPNQWCKFQQGTKQFIYQRRINGKNIPKVQ